MPQSIIRRIEVDALFGKFTYRIPRDGELDSPAILYGDNGVGKSTILNIAFHLLSSANDRGHRGALRKFPFKRFSVEISDNVVVSAIREADIDSELIKYTIERDSKLIAEWIHGSHGSPSFAEYTDDIFFSLSESGKSLSKSEVEYFRKVRRAKPNVKDGVARGNDAFLSILNDVAPKIFYLNADRKLDGDTVGQSSDAADIRRLLASREMKSTTDILRTSRNISLSQALENASRWVNRRAVSGANRGTENAHSAYELILDQISIDYASESGTADVEKIEKLIDTIDSIERDTRDFSRYDLAAELSMEKFKVALASGNENAVAISANLLEPYVKGLQTRIEAVRPLFSVLHSFVTTINEFLSGKELRFGLYQGFIIKDYKDATLDPSQLSSGEQQLLLIFAHVLAARDYPSVFIIDEPEISLNVKWQRKIVNSLLSIAEKSTIQFVFASHSLELIAQHADAVVEIGR